MRNRSPQAIISCCQLGFVVAVQFFPFQKNLRILVACFHFPRLKQQSICGSVCVKYLLYEFKNNLMGFVLYVL